VRIERTWRLILRPYRHHHAKCLLRKLQRPVHPPHDGQVNSWDHHNNPRRPQQHKVLGVPSCPATRTCPCAIHARWQPPSFICSARRSKKRWYVCIPASQWWTTTLDWWSTDLLCLPRSIAWPASSLPSEHSLLPSPAMPRLPLPSLPRCCPSILATQTPTTRWLVLPILLLLVATAPPRRSARAAYRRPRLPVATGPTPPPRHKRAAQLLWAAYRKRMPTERLLPLVIALRWAGTRRWALQAHRPQQDSHLTCPAPQAHTTLFRTGLRYPEILRKRPTSPCKPIVALPPPPDHLLEVPMQQCRPTQSLQHIVPKWRLSKRRMKLCVNVSAHSSVHSAPADVTPRSPMRPVQMLPRPVLATIWLAMRRQPSDPLEISTAFRPSPRLLLQLVSGSGMAVWVE